MATVVAADLYSKIPPADSDGCVNVNEGTITSAAQTSGDLFFFCKVPAGSRVHDLRVVNSASSASTTMQFGLVPLSDLTDTTLAGHFSAAASIASAGLRRKDAANAPITLSEDHYVVGTLGGANIATSTTISTEVDYVYEGPGAS